MGNSAETPPPGMPTTQDPWAVARGYQAKGFRIVPLRAGQKRPATKGWEEATTWNEAELKAFFGGESPHGIGLILGPSSGDLVDIDLDDPSVVPFADRWLPATGAVSGRPGARRSHRWYIAQGAKYQKFAHPTGSKASSDHDGVKPVTLLEIRTGRGGKGGHQTMAPPSFHPSGEQLVWEEAGDPAVVDAGGLERVARKIAAAAMLVGAWNSGQGRHSTALALAGVLAEAGRSEAETLDFVSAVAEEAGDDEISDRLAAVESTYDRHRRGEPIVGAGRGREGGGLGLESCIQPAIAKEVIQLLSGGPGSRAPRRADLSPTDTGANQPMEFGTDVEAADRFAREVHGRVAYVPGRGWMRFTGKRWETDSDAQEINQSIAKSGRDLMIAAAEERDHGRRREMLKAATRQLHTKNIRAIEALAKSHSDLLRDHTLFDADPYLLNLPNGTLHLKTKRLEPHRASDLLTSLAGVEYHPEERATRWGAFLDTTFDGDPDTISWFQRMCGYLLTGSTNEQVVFFFYGTGANGKSVTTSTLAFILGDYAKTAAFSTFLETKTNDPARARSDLARLNGARMVVAQESADGKRLSEGTVKALSGGDKVTARTLYRAEMEYTPQFKIILSSNYKPGIYGDDEGIWRRVRLVPFMNMIPAEERDPNLTELLRKEGPGILNWMLEGGARLLREGLGWCPAVAAASNQYRTEMDILGDFLQECCEEGGDLHVRTKELYETYVPWAKAQGCYPPSLKRFSMQLDHRGVGKQEIRKVAHRTGLRLRPRSESRDEGAEYGELPF